MASFRLYKSEKLCSQTAIDALFSRRVDLAGTPEATGSALSYPLRAVWRHNTTRQRGAGVQFLISVPKKRLRHAVDRVTMRRRIREAYRLNRQLLQTDDRIMIDLAFIYVASDLTPYRNIDNAMRRLLRRIAESQATCHHTTADETVASD
ncbi:MAG: ribonuclease P protein component [Muribaculaceae bacterium]|nr:ribonuclease P protein component [Muribaculaceae bacterium]